MQIEEKYVSQLFRISQKDKQFQPEHSFRSSKVGKFVYRSLS
jgi:hypothetical protein